MMVPGFTTVVVCELDIDRRQRPSSSIQVKLTEVKITRRWENDPKTCETTDFHANFCRSLFMCHSASGQGSGAQDSQCKSTHTGSWAGS